ncbi:hypothetical protein KDE13_09045 [Campylobacter sp. faydin G-140]|uniref:hypothetical protein n=1 Tax=Campylobacter anatolicus TaxID=2829105 RepID=UPI001B9078EE|nr:hypothetical protein [Campylobacter anatolicus]MBR8466479.1 hypothetical protein [Campylobacter anatolicus]
MKNIKVLFLALALNATFTSANDIDFKCGFEMAVKAIELELINGSNSNRAINFNYDKMLYAKTDKMSSNEILLTQYVAFSNGFLDTIYTGEKMYFGSFLREADRDIAKERLESLLNVKVEKERNDSKIKYAKPILNRNFYILKRNIVESSIKRAEYSDWSGDSYNKKLTKGIITDKQIEKGIEPITTEQNYFIPRKNKTEIFALERNPLSDSKNSHILVRVGITDMNKFAYEKTITDSKGNKYVKEKNDNLYIREEDVKFLER